MDSYEVEGAGRLLTFSGIILGSATSQKPKSARWTELTLYKTIGGSYVLEKIGRSLVTHMPGCPDIIGEIPRFQAAHPGEDPDEYEFHECVPETYDFTQLLVEMDRRWAINSDDPHEIVESLKFRKSSGEMSMPMTATILLGNVVKVEPAFREAWQPQHIA